MRVIRAATRVRSCGDGADHARRNNCGRAHLCNDRRNACGVSIGLLGQEALYRSEVISRFRASLLFGYFFLYGPAGRQGMRLLPGLLRVIGLDSQFQAMGCVRFAQRIDSSARLGAGVDGQLGI
ncbi:hypothetical protein [Achromobacter xylosoxidans]|uniref:hypothetical protein n=1 Tax=Alcaligenes xylosoxydans xylosoxydans TaxID=85698 RepID=UPI0022B93180|nr:hypothetical protein [Achromobacter xylosoxidans]MCZ8440637.1 hypothetical protein [Achromobacter xylosoxidans]